MKKKPAPKPGKTRYRRSDDEMIDDLQRRIEELKRVLSEAQRTAPQTRKDRSKDSVTGPKSQGRPDMKRSYACLIRETYRSAHMALLLVATCALSAIGSAQAPIFVDASAPAGGTGASWSTAFNSLQDGIDAAVALPSGPTTVQSVLVAEGTYNPQIPSGTPVTERGFKLEGGENVRIIGGVEGISGLPGSSIDPDNPDGSSRFCVLEGAIYTDPGGTTFPAVQSVVIVNDALGPSTAAQRSVENFTIQGGRASDSITGRVGGGVRIDSDGQVVIKDCLIQDNWAGLFGGGAYVNSGSATADIRFRSCFFFRNVAPEGGGLGVQVSQDVAVGSCIFRENGKLFAEGVPVGGPLFEPLTTNGGAIAIDAQAAVVCNNSLFIGNMARERGGAVYWRPFFGNNTNGDRTIILSSCTLSENVVLGDNPGAMGNILGTYQTDRGAGVHTEPGGQVSSDKKVLIENTILWNQNRGPDIVVDSDPGAGVTGVNVELDGADFQTSNPATTAFTPPTPAPSVGGVFVSPSVISVNPQFVNPTLFNYALQATSPCVDTGEFGKIANDFVDLDDDGDTTDALPFDLFENARVLGGPMLIDMGAIEFF